MNPRQLILSSDPQLFLPSELCSLLNQNLLLLYFLWRPKQSRLWSGWNERISLWVMLGRQLVYVVALYCRVELHRSIPLGFPGGSDGKESTCNARDPGSIPGLGRSPGEGNGNPLQYFCWRIPWTEEPGGLKSMESQTVGHNWATNTFFHFFIPLYSFPVAAVINGHKLSASKQYTWIPSQFSRSEVWNGFHLADTEVSSGTPSSGGSWGESGFLPLPATRGCLHALVGGSFLRFQSQQCRAQSREILWSHPVADADPPLSLS